MKFNKVIVLCSVLAVLFCMPVYAQKTSKPEKFNENHSPFGRKKKEKGNQRKKLFTFSFKRGKSKGNADDFASHSAGAKHGLFTRIFKGGGDKNASLRKTKPGTDQNKEQRALFRRSRTKNKNDHDRINHMQNKDRKKRRVRGNDAFKVKKR
jgi:hypothetical protein